MRWLVELTIKRKMKRRQEGDFNWERNENVLYKEKKN